MASADAAATHQKLAEDNALPEDAQRKVQVSSSKTPPKDKTPPKGKGESPPPPLSSDGTKSPPPPPSGGKKTPPHSPPKGGPPTRGCLYTSTVQPDTRLRTEMPYNPFAGASMRVGLDPRCQYRLIVRDHAVDIVTEVR